MIQCLRKLGKCGLTVRQRHDSVFKEVGERHDSVFKEVGEMWVGCTSKDEGITGLIVDSLPPILPPIISMRHKNRQFTSEV